MKKTKINVAVFVSGGGTNLQALIDSTYLIHANLSLVISNNKEAYALKRAENAGIPALTICKEDFADLESWEAALLSALEKHDIKIIVLAGFLSILSENFIKHYEKKIINIHPSLIPAFCGKGYYGLKVHEEALKRGVKISGATVHFVNEIPDGGEIIMQKAVDISGLRSAAALQKKIMEEAEWQILPKALELVCENLLAQDSE